jgi:hypothetical protein
MQFLRHLSDEELTDLVLEDDERHLRQALGTLPGSLRIAAERPDGFWLRQHAAMHERIAGVKRASVALLAAPAGALAMLAVAAVLLLRSSPPPVAKRPPAESDQQLLLSVEQSVHSDVPQALEPAALLADDVFSGAQSNQASRRTSQGEQQ